MGNGSLRFKDNSGNVISFISGSGTDITISGGTLNLLGMTEVALGNVTISGSTLVNGTGGISEVVISNTTTATIGSWTFSGSGTFFGVTKNAGSAATACTYLIEVMGNLA